MKRQYSPLLTRFLAALVLFQSMLVGWGYSHCHHQVAVTSAEHEHVQNRQHPADDQRAPQAPDDEDDCPLCRYLVHVSLLADDETDTGAGEVVSECWTLEPASASSWAVGLYRPRSPPALS